MFDPSAIVSWFKKTFSLKDRRLLLIIILLYLITRLVNLEKFPIFTDEGIYIHWAKIAWHDATWRFISLTDGKQPLQTWVTIPFLKLFPTHPLLAGRLFSVSSGLVALVGIFSLLFYLFGKRAAIFGSLFYIFTPYFLFYDRMALVDSAVNAGFIWIFFFSILMARTLRLDTALVSGIISGISLLAKSSTEMFVGLSVFAPVLFWQKNNREFKKKTIAYIILYLISFTLALIIYNVQRLSPFLHFVAEKNKTFVLTLGEFIRNPFAVVFGNLPIIPADVAWESGFILPFLGLLGLFFLFKKHQKLALYILLWILLPYLAIVFFAKVIFPRYLIFFASIFLILAVFYLDSLKNKKTIKLLLVLYFVAALYFDYTIVFAQDSIPFPPIDRGQYIEGISAGTGVKEIIDFARQKSSEKPVILIAEGNFGVVGDMLEATTQQGDQITIKGYWPLEKENLLENQKELKTHNVYIVYSHRNDFPQDLPLKFIQRFVKPGGQSSFYLFELTSAP